MRSHPSFPGTVGLSGGLLTTAFELGCGRDSHQGAQDSGSCQVTVLNLSKLRTIRSEVCQRANLRHCLRSPPLWCETATTSLLHVCILSSPDAADTGDCLLGTRYPAYQEGASENKTGTLLCPFSHGQNHTVDKKTRGETLFTNFQRVLNKS